MLGLGFERDKISGNVTHQIPEIKIICFWLLDKSVEKELLCCACAVVGSEPRSVV